MQSHIYKPSLLITELITTKTKLKDDKYYINFAILCGIHLMAILLKSYTPFLVRSEARVYTYVLYIYISEFIDGE